MNPIIETLRTELDSIGNEQTANRSRRFFKEPLKLYGITNPVIHQLSKNYFRILKELPKHELFSLCEELWQSGYHEEAIIACDWAIALKKQYSSDDLDTFEHWINNYVSNWAMCDHLCNHPVGELLMRFPHQIDRVKSWCKSPNRWTRRASAVSLIIPARKGYFMPDIFEIAQQLLTDPDEMVQKGYGWMLKVASQSNQQQVFDFVMQNKPLMPRTALRYAIEKMPPELKTEAMKKE